MGVALVELGCSTAAPIDGYPPRFTTGSGLVVSGELLDQAHLKIYVNGEKVIDDSLWLPRGDGEFCSHYEGKPLIARCSTSGDYKASSTACTVAIDDERRGTLRF